MHLKLSQRLLVTPFPTGQVCMLIEGFITWHSINIQPNLKITAAHFQARRVVSLLMNPIGKRTMDLGLILKHSQLFLSL